MVSDMIDASAFTAAMTAAGSAGAASLTWTTYQLQIHSGYGPIASALFTRGYYIALFGLVTMAYLRFNTDHEYQDFVWAIIGAISFAFFAFAAGGLNFGWPFPGAIWSLALSGIMFGFGILIGWMLFSESTAIRKTE